MRIVIAHEFAAQRAHLSSKLSQTGHLTVDRIVTSLHETYDYAEHHRPDCILMSGSLANCAEFEIMDSLLRMLGIGCVLLNDGDLALSPLMSPRAAEHVVYVDSRASGEAIFDALKQAKAPTRIRPASVGPTPSQIDFDPRHIILIGSSTGGVDALLKVLKGFPGNCPPTLIVQHTGGRYAGSLIRLLDGGTSANVIEARDGIPVSPGNIYLAPGDEAHLTLICGTGPRVSLKQQPQQSGHRPSVDALFQSAIQHGPHISAAILTGMGRDGAQGLCDLRQAGAQTFGQDEATSVVYGMPRVAMEMGGVEKQLPIEQMGSALLKSSQASVRG